MDVVYRCYDEDDRLLYIGVTYSIRTRRKLHRSSSPWWPEVRKIETESFDTRRKALDAERQAILDENPIHNRRRNFLPLEPIVVIERERIAG